MANFTLKKIVEHNALQRIPDVLKDLSVTGKILMVADGQTYKAAGEAAKAFLIAGGYQVHECILKRDEPLVPNEWALGEILVAMEPDTEVLLAVGSGSITDLVRYVSSKFNKPFIAVPTAPSMDGYASSVAPLTIREFKQTLPAVCPIAIVADIEVLAKAPTEMILAGLGDLMGKYTALADWKISSIINEEGFSEQIAATVRSTVDQTMAGLSSRIRDLILIQNLTEALIVSGEAMQQWGNSRPASGAEHHLAHFWEMQAALAGKKSHLHGVKVGIAVILVADLYHNLFNLGIEEVKHLISRCKSEMEEEYTARVKKIYGPLTNDVFADLKGLYLDSGKRTARRERIVANWDLMKNWVTDYVPTPGQLKELMIRVGAPVEVDEIEVNKEMLKQALQNAKEVRARYTVFRLAEDIGWN